MTITGTTWLDFLICAGILGSFSTAGYFIGRASAHVTLTRALDVMSEKYFQEARDHYQSRMRIAAGLKEIDRQARLKEATTRDAGGQLPDDYAD